MSDVHSTRQAYWQRHIEHFQESGLSGKQYCARESLTYHCFIYWRRKLLSGSPANSVLPTAASIGFVAVQPATEPVLPSSDTALELALPNGWVIGNIRSANLAVVSELLERLS